MLPERAAHDPSLFVGRVCHRRRLPVQHGFRYGLALLDFDVDAAGDLEGVAPWLGVDRHAPVSWWRRDHAGDPVPLGTFVRDLVQERTGHRPRGAIRLLTSPRVLGYGFNPISLFFCHDETGTPEAIVAEVTSTPWKERHSYVLGIAPPRRHDAVHRFVTPKQLHVSPFLGMQQDYRWRIALRDDRLSVAIVAESRGSRPFAATLSLVRAPLRPSSLAHILLRPPLGGAGTMAAIHFEALRLWWKGATYYPHPRHSAARNEASLQGEHRGDRACVS